MAIKGRKRKLESCPLCGKSAQLDEVENAVSNKKYYIHCTHCIICTWLVTKEEISNLCKKWNKRKGEK